MILLAAEVERLDRFLARALPQYSRTRLVRLIGEGGVRVDGVPRKPGFRVEPGMRVEIDEILPSPAHDLKPVQIELDVRWEDEHLLVINKARGMTVHPAPGQRAATLVNALLARDHGLSAGAASYRPGIVHRLDRDTTGLLVVAKTDHSHRVLADQFAAKRAERRYLAVVRGIPSARLFAIEAPIGRDPGDRLRMATVAGGKPARTVVRVISDLGDSALLALRLETGRTHQIRVHLRAIGHPVRGDSLYAPRGWSEGALQLHAGYLAFDHPVRSVRVAVEAEPPADFVARDRVPAGCLTEWDVAPSE